MYYPFADNETKTAYGVRFRSNDLHFTVKANLEVILSAGAIQSPQLLMLSGIGPKNHLNKIKIPVVHDASGVGKNLQDHVAIGGINYLVATPENFSSNEIFTFNLQTISSVATVDQFAVNRSGLLYSNPGVGAMAFINTKYVALPAIACK